MKHSLVIFLTAAILGTIFYIRANPQLVRNAAQEIVEKAKEVVSETPPSPRTDLLLPDMKIIPPKDIYIAHPSSKIKTLRFNTTFVNQGQGPLEIIGHHDLEQSKTFASQYIKKIDGSGEYRDIGSFVYHPDHSHWHVDNYVQYQIWSIKNKNEKNEIVATTGKMSFCIWDEHTYDLNLPEAAKSRFYTSACSRNTQGMSVGWGDTYLARVEGQVIDITNVPDGQYILWFEINPERRILESNYDNNADWLKIEIKGNKLTVL